MQIDAIDFRNPDPSKPFRPVDTFSCRRLANPDSLQEVLAFLDELHRTEPGFRFLCTLDDLNQCCYTSGHAQQHEHIDIDIDYDGIDFDNRDSVHAFDAKRLAHVAAQLQNPQLRLTWEDVPGTLTTADEDIDALVAMNREPSNVLDDVVYVQRLPVPSDDLLIAGLPNGYFVSDWNVFRNHAVIRRMQEQHGYRFFGIGASWLGFVREQPLQPEQAEHLVADLSTLYGCTGEATGDAWHELAEIVQGGSTLLLGYTENFAESV
ncbi:hypothetical protein [Paraburkholderia flava]|uniref:hypothetical protein n=1 Tax=Paraburkholderia flava TaxID=2547393 RepID=UPI0010615C90|nr:hypothetical protein [Paraburkholderia flava]